ncbi:MAG: hypothetical protein WC340_00820 [Kiritimatiellia bacterium]
MFSSKSGDNAIKAPSQWKVLRFYIPLAIQALSQSLTHPLVASIVSHGKLGSTELAAFAQGHSLMFVFGAIGGGLITTGMVFGTSKTGMRNFHRLVTRITIVVIALQIIVCLHPFYPFFFGRILGLEGELASIGRMTTLFSVPLQLAFMTRNKYLVALYNEKRSGLANTATMTRIIFTASLSPLFVHFGLTGYGWGLVAMTVPVFGEVFLTRYFARALIAKLQDSEADEKNPMLKQLRFTIPLSFGGILLSISSFMIAVFLSRAANPEETLAIHYIVMGIVSPLGFAALRMQSVVIAFPPAIYGKRRIFSFACMAGAILCLGPLSLQLRPISNWYFGSVQNLPPESIRLARIMAMIMAVQPLLQSLRGHIEGCAALRRRPNAILSGQAVYLATMVIALTIFQGIPAVPGYVMGGLAILCALLMSLTTVHTALIWNDFEDTYGGPSERAPAIDITQK